MRLVIDSQLSEIRRATEFVNEFRARHGLAEEDAMALCILLDEVLSNAIRHGLDGTGSHAITVTLELAEGEVRVEVEDDGVAYDPTEAPAPALGGKLEDRQAGGLGLTFMRALTESIEYRRVDGRNRLVMRRRVKETSPPGP